MKIAAIVLLGIIALYILNRVLNKDTEENDEEKENESSSGSGSTGGSGGSSNPSQNTDINRIGGIRDGAYTHVGQQRGTPSRPVRRTRLVNINPGLTVSVKPINTRS